MSYLRASIIIFVISLMMMTIFKDSVFRYAPNIAVIYNDNDFLTSRRVFHSGRVWKFWIGHRLSLDVENIEGGGTRCLYKFDNINEAKKYEDAHNELFKVKNGSMLIQCNGRIVNKYFKISINNGIISEVDMTVSMIGTV